MKASSSFLVLLLISFTTSLCAQLPADLAKLDGTWQCRNCTAPTWSFWSYQPDGTLLNLTLAQVGGETVELSRLEISQRNRTQTILRWIQPGQPMQTFRLTRLSRHDLLWENENMASLLPTLHISFYGSRRMVVDGTTALSLEFRRKRQKDTPAEPFAWSEPVASR